MPRLFTCSLLVVVTAALNDMVGLALQQRGLTRREAEAVQFRHKRNTGGPLTMEVLQSTLAAIDDLPNALLDGQVAELLRATTMDAIRSAVKASPDGRWCSYKRKLCDCGGRPLLVSVAAEAAAAPRLLAIDCEFKPLRFAAVDEEGSTRLDCLVLPDVAPAGRSSAPLPSILRCDRPQLVGLTEGALRAQLTEWMALGTRVLAHTPVSDLRALGIPELEVIELQRRGLVVDVALLDLAQGDQVASLKRMAERYGVAPPGFQEGGAKHCAIQDAVVAMALFKALRPEMPPKVCDL